jgi:hypothetical protein
MYALNRGMLNPMSRLGRHSSDIVAKIVINELEVIETIIGCCERYFKIDGIANA